VATELIRVEEKRHIIVRMKRVVPPQLKGKIEHFVSRKAMNITAGVKTIEQLFDKEVY
jgi:DNA ligase (NAD+)